MPVSIDEFKKFIAENKGQRKFKQTVEVAINFKDIDFTKPDNRLNMDIPLPNGKGKVKNILIFANDKNLVETAKKNNMQVIDTSELESVSKDPKRLTSLLNYDLLAQASAMPLIARFLGQFLGPRNRMPKAVMPNTNIGNMVQDLGKSVSIKSKGKYLPTVHSIVGTEDMEPEKIYANIGEIIKMVGGKVGQNNIKSAYVKMTMSKPIKFI
jgi:large subunit ribosomal protein L1